MSQVERFAAIRKAGALGRSCGRYAMRRYLEKNLQVPECVARRMLTIAMQLHAVESF